MTKTHFMALADAIREHNRLMKFRTGTGLEHLREGSAFDERQLETLANFCQRQNQNFNRSRWLNYVAGNCGRNGEKQ
jgi:hypothetical protein